MKRAVATPPTPAMGNTPRRSHFHPLAYLSSRRGIVVLAVALFGTYELFSLPGARAPSAFVPQTIKDNWGWRAADERWDANQAIEVNRISPKKEATAQKEGGPLGTAEEVKQEKEVTWFVADEKKANAAPANPHGSSRTDHADDELGLSGLSSSTKEKLRDQAKAPKQVRPFGKAPANENGDKTSSHDAHKGSKSGAAVDVSSGSKVQDKTADDFDDENAGSALFSPDEMALADAPNMAAVEDAAARAPMAALPAKSSEAMDETSTGSQSGGAAAPVVARVDSHAAARVKDADTRDEPAKEAPAAAADDKKKPLAGIVGALSKPKKIGTGGRVVQPADVEAGQKPAQRVGAGAKAGAVVQQEAGRRVGTGARPGAKGMAAKR
ncbi:branchpoint-bridging protein [Rhodotorula toruloides]|uniref:Branchpoint-bridging protein n=1 Tax=Rhodotorula toruloides TaxID=5286 RepID=A0A511KBX4_RHOTO|nr:branchpoint-bridging protein [Rhodotorula toruloides]